MEQKQPIAQFTVSIFSVEGATWQGVVTAGEHRFEFQSEMQLLKWLWATCPTLTPDNNPSVS